MERSAPVELIPLDQARQLEEPRRPIFRLLTPTEAVLLMILRMVGAFMGFQTQVAEMLRSGMILAGWAAPQGARVALSYSGSSGRFS
ncbi:MAG: hypothetical protein MUO38_10590 [Anaerolineales bacterium]|nr:hypothetical protein [Anaerolineales bacterium]